MGKAAGKGDAPRQSDRPAWAGLPEIERNGSSVVFKTSFGYHSVPLKYVEAYEKRTKTWQGATNEA